jgi:hypothetical protein
VRGADDRGLEGARGVGAAGACSGGRHAWAAR